MHLHWASSLWAVSESQERDENPTNWIAHETPTNWIALSLDSSLKHYCQMLKALIHPHPLLASLTRAGVSCLLHPVVIRPQASVSGSQSQLEDQYSVGPSWSVISHQVIRSHLVV